MLLDNTLTSLERQRVMYKAHAAQWATQRTCLNIPVGAEAEAVPVKDTILDQRYEWE